MGQCVLWAGKYGIYWSVAYNENKNYNNVQIGIVNDGRSSVYLVDSISSALKYHNSSKTAVIPLKKKFLQIILFKIQFLP